jgi:hypothetical protein
MPKPAKSEYWVQPWPCAEGHETAVWILTPNGAADLRAYSALPATPPPPCSIWIKLRFTSGTFTRLMRLRSQSRQSSQHVVQNKHRN